MRDESVDISVVTPVYGYELDLERLYTRLKAAFEAMGKSFEIIMVNDGSPDNAWETITRLASRDPRVRGVNLTRNFGQHHAITAGVDQVRGNWVVVMDCDGQDRPEEIHKLYSKALGGYDIVLAQRAHRKDTLFARFFSWLFFRLLSMVSDIRHDPSISSFGIYSRRVIDSVQLYREQFRSFGILVHRVGYRKRIAIPVEHAKREIGRSAYTFRKKLNFVIDTVVASSNRPLVLSIQLGFLMAVLSFMALGAIVFRYVAQGVPVVGWASMIASIYLVGGLSFISLGFLGLYLGKVFDEVKKRPLYLIQETTFAVDKAKHGL